MNRISIINSLIAKNNYTNYLEIGVQGGDCFSTIECKNKVGVDPDKSSAATIHLTSDDFFEQNKSKFDVIFIDGLHHADQVIKDIDNSLKVLKKGGTIVMHDCLPNSKRMQEIPLQEQDEWCGNVWEAFIHFRSTRNDLTMYVVDTDWGCGIIQKGSQELLVNDYPISYENFVTHKQWWMNIISVDQFKLLYL